MAHLDEKIYNIGPRKEKYAFAGFPSVKLYKSSEGTGWNNHLLFGDYLKIQDTAIVNNRVLVRSRNSTGWIGIDEIYKDRLLEVNFVDIGQGDGCHVVTPDDKHIIVDAGLSDNMNRYLSWRFNLLHKNAPLSMPLTAIISHSDADHYKGFGNVFENEKLFIDKIYHNGLVERPGDLPLGDREDGYITGLVKDTRQMLDIIEQPENRKGKRSQYCKILYKVLEHSPQVKFESLTMDDHYVEGFGEGHTVNDTKFSIKILAPITETVNGKDALKSINNLGKDKNGHSVVLKVVYDKARILLGGDINTEFGEIILNYYKQARKTDELQVDVSKACHHGSNHFHYGFLEALNPNATVISSGDDESYSHPRPDALGAFGKCGYGDRPLIFSTELARSNKEFTSEKLKSIARLYNDLEQLNAEIKAEKDKAEKEKLYTKRSTLNKKINSNLTRYGMINVRTDGRRMIIAQKYEKPATHGKWDIQKLVYSEETQRFELQ